ncbi:anti-sigma factor [Sulfitobacter noctilucicola]|uniref:Regulator of SigK n=2 Tax=Sulfitobacter noctilucicola TaxID=1342301 RepID=A0A7W6M9M8_9RHOB|nr:anti-sigma factor [Sulfitobacter noctilucicola]MBB4174717.1 anti-sigma-K factor RskA [Sulfitobacter noctilucicola]
MDDIPTTDEPGADDAMLAAEYALGLTPVAEIDTVRARARHDAAFAQRVAAWQERFVAMTDGIDPVKPPRKLRRKLLAEVFPKVSVPVMQRLWVWQGIALAALVLAAYLATPLLQPDPESVPRNVFAAHMTGESGDLELLVVVDTDGDIALRRVAGAVPEGRVLELWAILPDAAPQSLGVLPADAATRVRLPEALVPFVSDITLAISDEPPGGAPGAAPTGDIRAVGTITAL